ncbi:MAG: hypothetical protein U1F25_09480 [Rubrivivax sp.]
MSITYTTTGPAGERITWRDRKRYAWALSVLWPLLPFTGLAAHHASGSEWALALPLLISYGLMPLADALIGEDENNPPEAVVGALDADRYYRWLTWATVPLHFVALIGCAWWAGTHDLSWPALLLLAYVAGADLGPGSRTPRTNWGMPGLQPCWEQWLASAWHGGAGLRPLHGGSTAAATTAGWPRPRTTPARAWASRSTASRCASHPAASAAPGRWKANGRAPPANRAGRGDNTMLQSTCAVTLVLQR